MSFLQEVIVFITICIGLRLIEPALALVYRGLTAFDRFRDHRANASRNAESANSVAQQSSTGGEVAAL